MASLIKPTYTKTDPKTGKRVQRRSRKWYGKFRDMQGAIHRVPLCTDKTAAQGMLRDEIRKVERRLAGLTDPHDDHLNTLFSVHIADFKKHLEGKGNTGQYVNQSIMSIERLVSECGFRRLADLQASKVANWLNSLTMAGRSARTFNSYLTAIKGFCNWLVKDQRLPANPLAHLSRLNTKTDPRHQRRSLTPDEFERLIESATTGPIVECIDGRERAIIYIVACWTGLRRKELGSLTRRSFDLSSETPSVTVNAGYSKRRRDDTIPLHRAVADRLREWLAAKGEIDPHGPIFALRTASGNLRDTAKMMRLDLNRAAIPYRNQDGLYADFHANRHTFISNLSRTGASPKVAQTLARHSDINLTMETYTHLGVHDQIAAIGDLPAPPSIDLQCIDAQQNQVTETDDRLVPMLVPTCVPGSPNLSTVGNEPEHSAVEQETPKPLENQGFENDYQPVSSSDGSAPSRTRTLNLLIKSQLLCQLS